MKIAIYARVSPTTKKEGKNVAFSIENQLKRCRKQAEADGVEVYKEYYDEYISGKTQEYMLSFKKMIEDARERKFNKIYTLRVDRFGRNSREMLNAEYELKNINVFIKFIEQGFDTSDSIGKMMMTILSGFAEWQREDIITKTSIGREIAYKNNPEKFGRPKAIIDWKDVHTFLNAKNSKTGKYQYSWTKIAERVGISTATLLRHYRAKYGEVIKRRIWKNVKFVIGKKGYVERHHIILLSRGGGSNLSESFERAKSNARNTE